MADHRDDRRDSLTPEERAKLKESLALMRSAAGRLSFGGVLGALGRGVVRRKVRRTVRRRRPRGRKLAFFGVGVLVMLLSISTCSAGVDLASMTQEYGPPVPADREAARQFVERTAAAVRNAPASRRLRIEVTDVEATSALSLGLMMPELMRAMETMPAEEVRSIDDLAVLRERLRQQEAAGRESLDLRHRITAILDPQLRTGDVQVRFTSGGEVVVAGYIQAWRWQQPALVVLAPRAHNGEVELDFRRGRLGRVPAPEWAFDRLGGLASSLLFMGRDYAEIQDITVEEGRMRFVGIARR